MERFDYRTRTEVFREGSVALDLHLIEDFESESARLYAHRGRLGLPATVELSPMFGVIWPSARVATRWVSDVRPGETVFEIGCGLGLPSLVAASRGARVLASDNHPDAVPFLRDNARRNGLEVETCHYDVHTTRLQRHFSRVIATDVLFASDMPAAVAVAFHTLLAPRGRGLLVDPGRPWLDTFLAAVDRLDLQAVLDVDVACGEEFFAVHLQHRSHS